MKKIQIIFLFLCCLVQIGWAWQKPKDQILMQQGYEAWKAGNFNVAIDAYESVLSLKPRNTDALNFLGVIYEEIGYPEKAENKYLTAIIVDREYLPAYLNLGLLYWNKGDKEKATYYFQKRVEMGRPSDPWTQKAKAALKSIESSKDVIVTTTMVMDHEKEPTGASVKKAPKQDQERLKVINQALDSINQPKNSAEPKVETTTPKVVKAPDLNALKAQELYIQGQQLVSAQRYQEAIQVFDRALKITPGNPEVIRARVGAFLKWKEQATAE